MLVDYNQDLAERLYASMLRIRKIEEMIIDVYYTDVIKSPVHLSIGQEATAAGVCDALRHSDMVSNTYRGHGTYIAKGGDLRAMVAELYGKKTGCAEGKAGSMHLIDIKNGVIGCSAVVGTTIPIAAGYAMAAKMDCSDKVIACFFGDGATEEGCFSETINFAALHKLPILFVCENNLYAIHNHIENRWPTRKIRERMQTYGIPTSFVEDGDVFKIRNESSRLIEEIRSGSGPRFIEIMTYRYTEHVGPKYDPIAPYRDTELYNYWKSIDQIDRLAKILPDDVVARINAQVASEVLDAKEFSENSPFPTEGDLYTHVYAN